MLFPFFRSRLVWFFLVVGLLMGVPEVARGQQQPVNLSNVPGRPSHGFTPQNEVVDWIRNHGTGLRGAMRWGTLLPAVRGRAMPAPDFEAGLFHQRRLGRLTSAQVELSYYQERATRGLRLPVLLIFNPLDNISLHAGPVAQWAALTGIGTDTERTGDVRVLAALGAEARAGSLRVGLRMLLPDGDGYDPAATWRHDHTFLYLGLGL